MPLALTVTSFPTQCASNQLMEGRRSARKTIPALKNVMTQSFVHLIIRVSQEENLMVRYKNYFKRSVCFLIVPCICTSDCSKEKTNKVCKESPETMEKACEKPGKKSCKDGCADGEYCNDYNVCRNGKIPMFFFF